MMAGPLTLMESHDIPVGALVMIVGLQGPSWWGVVKSQSNDVHGRAMYLLTMDEGLEGWWHRSLLVWSPRLGTAPAHAISREGSRA